MIYGFNASGRVMGFPLVIVIFNVDRKLTNATDLLMIFIFQKDTEVFKTGGSLKTWHIIQAKFEIKLNIANNVFNA